VSTAWALLIDGAILWPVLRIEGGSLDSSVLAGSMNRRRSCGLWTSNLYTWRVGIVGGYSEWGRIASRLTRDIVSLYDH
jgi:hypothetical protein